MVFAMGSIPVRRRHDGKDGASADYYVLRASTSQFHVDKDGNWDNTVTVSLWHVQGRTCTQVKEDTAEVTLSATVGTTSWSAKTRFNQGGTLDLASGMADASDFDDDQRQDFDNMIEYGTAKEVTISDNTHGAASITITVTRDGAAGTDGNAVKSVTEYYLITNSTTAPNRDDEDSTLGWTTDVQTPTKTKRYLWNYEKTEYTKSDPTYTDPHIIGMYSEDGVSIRSITEHYLATSVGEGVTTSNGDWGTWTTEVQTITSEKKYLWNYETITYSNGNSTDTEPHIIGAYGDKGADGNSYTLKGKAVAHLSSGESFPTLSVISSSYDYYLWDNEGTPVNCYHNGVWTGVQTSIGDAYVVDGELWVWNGTIWNDVGAFTGPQGEAGADALYLDCDPAAVVWNQEGDVTYDESGNITDDTRKWNNKYIHVHVRRGSLNESGWTITASKVTSGYEYHIGTYTEDSNGKLTFTEDEGGTWVELSNPVQRDGDSSLWTEGTIRIRANKTGETELTRDVPIALNALGEWKISVVNDAMNAVSSKVETTVNAKLNDKGLAGDGYDTTINDMKANIEQNAKAIDLKVAQTTYDTAMASMNERVGEIEVKSSEISLMVTSMRSGRNLWIDGGFDMAEGVRPTWVHNQSSDADGKDSESISDTDVPAGFTHSLVFTCRLANNGIYFTKAQQPYAVPTTAVPYCLSFWARSTMACKMAVGLEGVALGYADLTTEWQRFAIYYSADSDYSKWSGATVFYPMTALVDSNGNSGNVYLTGIQFETGTEKSYAPTAWSESVFDLMKTGIDIQQGVINAIAEKFNFVGQDGKPYIRVSQDSGGYPHLVFYDPNYTVDGEPIEAYDLGYTGLSQIVNSSQKQSWGSQRYQMTFEAGAEVTAEDIYRQLQMAPVFLAYIFYGAYFVNKAGTQVWVPSAAEDSNGKYYDAPTLDSDGLPSAALLADGWHLVYQSQKYTSEDYTIDDSSSAIKSRQYQYTYSLFYTEGGVYKGGGNTLTITYATGSAVTNGNSYVVSLNDSTGADSVTFPDAPTT